MVRKSIQENLAYKLPWLRVSDFHNIALFVLICCTHLILRTVNSRMVANEGGQSRTHCQLFGFSAEIRKKNPFNKPRELPMGETASALEFWTVNFYCAYKYKNSDLEICWVRNNIYRSSDVRGAGSPKGVQYWRFYYVPQKCDCFLEYIKSEKKFQHKLPVV